MAQSTHHVTLEHYLVTHHVGPNQGGIRLDHFLKERYRRRSRESIQRAIDEGEITINRHQGRHVSVGRLKPSTALLPGDEVRVLTERKPEPDVDFNYKVIFEDDDLFVIDKPAQLPVHPAGRYYFNTLLVHLKTRGFQDPLKAEREYFLAHRIDKETSGILVLAKTKEICAGLTAQFAARTTKKRYLAVVRGVPPEQFTVDAPMARSPTSKIELKMAVLPESLGGLNALTEFRRLEVAGDFALVECFPKTGRQHQIRVHLDHVGHPLVGDKLYGMPEEDALYFFERELLTPERWAKLHHSRHALHAASLGFEHPSTKKWMEFQSDLPADLRGFLDRQK
ncbi:RluA family pseudouridine synthase [bacterium]|nr:RluA family pseudouridine synthase [bacterium]